MEVTRNFSVPADEMLEAARTKHGLFLNNKTDFTDEDSDFDDPFAANFLTSIEASEATETAETREDEQQQETADVLQAMAEGARVYTMAKYYIEKTFADKPDIMNKFGLDNFSTEGQTQKGMAIFLANLHKQCQVPAYKTALLAKNMTQAKIDQIKTALDAFTSKNETQNVFIEETPEATATRNAQYNGTYKFMQDLNRASKVVYFGNPIKLNQFALPHGSEGENFNVEGKVLDGSNANQPLKGVQVGIKELGITVFTNFYGNYGFVDIPAGTYTIEFILSGYANIDHPFTVTQQGKVTVNQTLTVQ